MMKKKIAKILLYGLPGILALVMFSCYPSGPSSTADTDVVITAYDSQFNFAAVRTYAMPNVVFELEGSDPVKHDFDDVILDEIEKNMNAIGYVRENNPLVNGADVVVIASIGRTDRTWVGDGGWWGWWGGWPGWGYWPGYGPGWGIWYPWPVMGSFSTGTLFIEMLDLQESEQFVVRSLTIQLDLAVLVGGTQRFDRRRANVDFIAAQISCLAETFGPQLSVPVG